MEELIGKLWHQFITRKALKNNTCSHVKLVDIKSQLSLYYQAMGGEAGKIIVPAQARLFKNKRPLVQRIAGTHRKQVVSWQDKQTINLPAIIHYFDNIELNQALYFWLVAIMANLPTIQHWFADNQQACATLLATRPGLKSLYLRLVQASIENRTRLTNLQNKQKIQEETIRAALIKPGCVKNFPLSKGEAQPVYLWIYPAPLRNVCVAPVDEKSHQSSYARPKTPQLTMRKQARRIDDSQQTDGLLVFQAESLFSWAEQVELDRCQQEDLDEDLPSTAEDLDIVTLSRQRRSGSAKIKFDLDLPAPQNDDLRLGEGIRFPEWDYRKASLIENYCLLQPMLADSVNSTPLPEHLKPIARKFKQRFRLLQSQRHWLRRQPYGEEIDVDAWLRIKTQPIQDLNQQTYYRARRSQQRDVACLLLADLSMSTDTMLTEHQSVIDIIKDTLLVFSEALNDVGDAFAIYGFSSVKNTHIRYHILKNFNQIYNGISRGLIMASKAGYYTRMGTAIRQSAQILKLQQSQQKLLIVISDGKPNDIDHYEGRYGIEDTRHAIIEAKQQGLQPFCVTIDDQANDYLPYLFGDHSYTIISDVSKLPEILPRLYLKLTGEQ